MTPMHFIRKQVFGFESQEKFGDYIGCSQAHVSRMETEAFPISRSIQDAIRKRADECGIAWDNNWFFEAPQEPATAA